MMDANMISDMVQQANAMLLNGLRSGQEIGRQESAQRIAVLEAEVVRLQTILRDEFDYHEG
jgi:hypothetical protein